ncbi:Bug family tripartite tricarboxylate transporter substrate binding protein [Achromobacter aloeverae]|nr:tripartite tricarboxylate transporter substrate binding protein [Achromobacter aloeverae]
MARRVLVAGLLAGALGTPLTGMAQGDAPIRMIMPYTPGGGADTLGRLVATSMNKRGDRNILVENKPGANTILATDYVSTQKPDGNTLLYASSSFTINPHLYKVNYDPASSFTPIALLSEIPLVMVTTKDSPFQKVQDVVDKAKAKPGQVSFASYGLGSAAHLGGVLFESKASVKMLHVPYKGSMPALNDLMGHHVDVAIVSLESALAMIKGGELRALGIFNQDRLSSLPDVPTMVETVPGCVAVGWNGILAPKGLDPAVVKKLNDQVNQALVSSDLKQYFINQGLEPRQRSPEEFAQAIKDENAKWGQLVKAAGLTLQ